MTELKPGDLYRLVVPFGWNRTAFPDIDGCWDLSHEHLQKTPVGTTMMLVHIDVKWVFQLSDKDKGVHILLHNGQRWAFTGEELSLKFEKVSDD